MQSIYHLGIHFQVCDVKLQSFGYDVSYHNYTWERCSTNLHSTQFICWICHSISLPGHVSAGLVIQYYHWQDTKVKWQSTPRQPCGKAWNGATSERHSIVTNVYSIRGKRPHKYMYKVQRDRKPKKVRIGHFWFPRYRRSSLLPGLGLRLALQVRISITPEAKQRNINMITQRKLLCNVFM